IKLTRRFTIGKTIMGNFIEPALLEIIADFAAVYSIFWRVNSEDFAEEFERPLSVTFEICEDFPHVEVPFCAIAACIEQKVPRDGYAHDRATNVDVRKIEGFSVERNETLRADLTNVGPEIGQ